jgi:exopolysaccharide biosynthesis polyprenyl glycosylphosphotransferase
MSDGSLPHPRATLDDSSLGAKMQAVATHSADALDAALRLGPVPGPPGRDYALPASVRRVRRRWRTRYTKAVVTLDLLASLAGAAAGAAWLSAGPAWLLLVYPFVVVSAFTLARTYEHRFIAQGDEELRRLVVAGTFLVAATGSAALLTGWAPLRALALLGLPLTVLAAVAGHLGARSALLRGRRSRHGMQRCVAIGLERSVAELVRTARAHPECGLHIVGACISTPSAETVEEVPVLGTPDDALTALRAACGDTVVLTSWSDVSQEQLRLLSWDLEGSGVELLVAPRLTEVAVPRLRVRTVGDVPLLHVDEPEFAGLRRVAKTALDYALTVPALLVLSPVLLAVGLAVRVSSPGPVLFRQERVGRYGRPFTMHKFRSMYVDAEDRLAELAEVNQHGDGPLFKMRDDPRVTPVGAFLRRYSLDELPQLLDVLAGTMSLVGPRPPLPSEVAQYDNGVRRRMLVKPGITGLWQVSGRSDLSWQESVRLDLSYVENWRLALDLSILARTVSAVLASRGAY